MSISRSLPSKIPSLKKGDRLYAAITYKTPNVFIAHYLPKPYFVLEVFVEQVSDGSGGTQYFFDTDFQLDFCFVSKDLESAQKSLVQSFETEMGFSQPLEKIWIVASEDYKREAKIHQSKIRA
jgi:hypothetical protein